MLNPDGVIYGNYRCSLLGVDLNRRWLHPNRHMHPTIWYTKRLIQSMSEDREVSMYIDFHGHSMKRNVFSYGCREIGKDLDIKKTNFVAKMVPVLMSNRNKLFSLSDSKFRIEKCKAGTARVVAFKEMKIIASYTIESSFFGPYHSACLENRVPYKGEVSKDPHIEKHHLATIGKDVCKLLTTFISGFLFRRRAKRVIKILKSRRKAKVQVCEEVQEEAEEDSESSNGSEYASDEEDFNMNEALNGLDYSFMSDNRSDEEDDSSGSGGSNYASSDREDVYTLPTEESPKDVLMPPRLSRREQKPIKRSGSNERVSIIRPASVQPRKNSSAAPLAKLKLRVVEHYPNVLDSPARFDINEQINNVHKMLKFQHSVSIAKRDAKKGFAPLKAKMFLDQSLQEPKVKVPQVRVTNTGGGFRSSPVQIKGDHWNASNSFVITSFNTPAVDPEIMRVRSKTRQGRSMSQQKHAGYRIYKRFVR
ncbi:unnamed protein product [Blepharisma stoltei]|uniref:Peptidase M14 domain-containing protein n=1 Tax=Blepharisma stoltei TaxID=1481888 RepID=A0AAU9IKH8_9CILI|nr:unnamed protein product [Blepharisma stoltei]